MCIPILVEFLAKSTWHRRVVLMRHTQNNGLRWLFLFSEVNVAAFGNIGRHHLPKGSNPDRFHDSSTRTQGKGLSPRSFSSRFFFDWSILFHVHLDHVLMRLQVLWQSPPVFGGGRRPLRLLGIRDSEDQQSGSETWNRDACLQLYSPSNNISDWFRWSDSGSPLPGRTRPLEMQLRSSLWLVGAHRSGSRTQMRFGALTLTWPRRQLNDWWRLQFAQLYFFMIERGATDKLLCDWLNS